MGLLLLLGPSAVFDTALAKDPLTVDIVRITREVEQALPLSLLDSRIENNGRAGMELGLFDNRTTGDFLGHEYELHDVVLGEEDAVDAAVLEHLDAGRTLFLLDLNVEDILAALAVAPQNPGDALFLNVRSRDDRLRNAECHANLLHVTPSRAMLGDALAQYLAWKRWNKAVLVTGRHPEDALFAAAMQRAAGRFGLKWVAQEDWTFEPGARRTDSGHHNAQQEIPAFTSFKDHDVLVVADERDEFGEYLSYRSRRPRPVAGTQGLTPTSWHRTHEQWGATQIQRRFEKLAERTMTRRDYSAWLGMRAIGEAVTNTGSDAVSVLREFLLSDRLTLAGFKGVPLSFRNWNGQLRQPVLLVAPRMLISVSPQTGYLHEFTELDTLGYDRPESACDQF